MDSKSSTGATAAGAGALGEVAPSAFLFLPGEPVAKGLALSSEVSLPGDQDGAAGGGKVFSLKRSRLATGVVDPRGMSGTQPNPSNGSTLFAISTSCVRSSMTVSNSPKMSIKKVRAHWHKRFKG